MTVGDKEVLNSEGKREFESSKGNAKRAGWHEETRICDLCWRGRSMEGLKQEEEEAISVI